MDSLKIGAKYNQLRIVGPVFRVRMGSGLKKYHVARCSCGNYVAAQMSDIANGRQKSCGCWRVKVGAALGKSNTTHGETGNPLYVCWHDMQLRCYYPSTPSYADYGKRGIKMCKEWRHDYVAFRDWALANGYQEGLHIDRENNEGDYTPENCRFVTCKINQRNRRSNALLTFRGETRCLIEWMESGECNTTYHSLQVRVKNGWTAYAALKVPTVPRGYRTDKELTRMLSSLKEGEKIVVPWAT